MQCSPALVAPSRYVSELMEFSLALGGPTLQAQYERFRAHPDGQRLLRERPDLPAVLADRDALGRMPDGSFGRAYLDFTGRYRFDAAAFEEGHDLEGMAQRLGWDDDLLYVITMGTPELGERTVREAIEVAAPGGGFILGTSDSIREGTPMANIRAYFEAAQTDGAYR